MDFEYSGHVGQSSRVFSRINVVIAGGVVFLALVVAMVIMVAPPESFPTNQALLIEEGLSVERIGALLEEQHYVRSAQLFVFLSVLTNAERSTQSGSYVFNEPQSVFGVIQSLQAGENRGQVRITLPEGITVNRMGKLLQSAIPHFDVATFQEYAKEHEGYLFPDTYFIDIETRPQQVIMLLRNTFQEKTQELREQARQEGQQWDDIVIMASLLEGEAITTKDREIIAGILWKRISIGMPLQVDAPFFYLLGKGSLELSEEDLNINSPYNTYRYRGLPPTPINNPGLDALSAALSPQETPYFFYLSDGEGTIHYARTHDQHVDNKNRYLR